MSDFVRGRFLDMQSGLSKTCPNYIRILPAGAVWTRKIHNPKEPLGLQKSPGMVQGAKKQENISQNYDILNKPTLFTKMPNLCFFCQFFYFNCFPLKCDNFVKKKKNCITLKIIPRVLQGVL